MGRSSINCQRTARSTSAAQRLREITPWRKHSARTPSHRLTVTREGNWLLRRCSAICSTSAWMHSPMVQRWPAPDKTAHGLRLRSPPLDKPFLHACDVHGGVKSLELRLLLQRGDGHWGPPRISFAPDSSGKPGIEQTGNSRHGSETNGPWPSLWAAAWRILPGIVSEPDAAEDAVKLKSDEPRRRHRIEHLSHPLRQQQQRCVDDHRREDR